ncbi:hypothetical protein P4V41_07735 [Fictibacillus nanhaiensis]|uniref:hypothetical protein n=1 Tax=Fictibacillus nanhaiensis TaxID=742169 RepID=UPI002E1B2F00|nr:hypothetical protein [Fictibacillus nanhaiensis]
MKDYEKVYDEFWKDLVENEDGSLNLDQVKRELADFRLLIQEVPKVYEELTGLSKPLTRAEAILSIVNDKYIRKEYMLDDIYDMADEDGKVSVETLQHYLK